MTKLTNFMKMIADDMYERYHREGVETDEDFDSMENIDFKHEVIDSAISSEYTGDTEDMINEFGIGKAIFITLGAGMEFQGMDPREISATLLYQIVMEKLDDFFIYEDYLVYKSEKDEKEDLSCHHCGMLPAPFYHEGQRRCEEHKDKDLCGEECDTEDEKEPQCECCGKEAFGSYGKENIPLCRKHKEEGNYCGCGCGGEYSECDSPE